MNLLSNVSKSVLEKLNELVWLSTLVTMKGLNDSGGTLKTVRMHVLQGERSRRNGNVVSVQ